MQHKNRVTNPDFVLTDRSNQQLLDGAKLLAGRHRTVTAHLIAHLAEIYSRKLHVAEGFSYLGDYCVGALGLSEDEGHRRAHAAVLAQKYPVILDMLLEGSIHLTSLRVMGKCLTPDNHRQVLDACRGKTMTELEHLAAAICPKPDVPAMLRKLPEPRPKSLSSGEGIFRRESVLLTALTDGQPASDQSAAHVKEEIGVLPAEPGPVSLPRPAKSRLAPLSPRRYDLHVTVDEETYLAIKQLQDLQRHQIRNGDLARIIKDSVLDRLERVEREKLGPTKGPRTARKQESWIAEAKTATAVSVAEEARAAGAAATEVDPGERAVVQKGPIAPAAVETESIAPGRSKVTSRHIPAAVKREVWKRDQGRCAFVSRSGRRCSSKARLEFHHVHAYALGGPGTVENIALRCRTHNAYEGVALFGEKNLVRSGTNPRESAAGPPARLEQV